MLLKAILTLVLTGMWFSVVAENQTKVITSGVCDKTDTSNLFRKNASPLKSDADEPSVPCTVKYGFKIGVTMSNTNFNKGYPKPSEPIETNWKSGFTGGFILEVPLCKKLFLQQEYAYAFLRGEVKDAGATYNISYMSLPVFLKLNLSPKFAIMAGPQFDLLVQARESYNGSFTDITHGIEERNVSAVAGIIYRLTNQVSIDARFAQGLNHIGLTQGRMPQEFKLQTVQFAISYSLMR